MFKRWYKNANPQAIYSRIAGFHSLVMYHQPHPKKFLIETLGLSKLDADRVVALIDEINFVVAISTRKLVGGSLRSNEMLANASNYESHVLIDELTRLFIAYAKSINETFAELIVGLSFEGRNLVMTYIQTEIDPMLNVQPYNVALSKLSQPELLTFIENMIKSKSSTSSQPSVWNAPIHHD